MFHLVVTRAFGQYRPGQRITDPTEVEAAQKDYAANVVQIPADAADASAPVASPKSGKSK